MNTVASKLDTCNSMLSKLEVYDSLKQQLVKEVADSKLEIDSILSKTTVLEKSSQVLLNFSEMYKKLVVEKIESLITEGIQVIFENPSLAFRLNVESKRNNIDMSFKIYNFVTKQQTDLLYGESGGIKNVVAILLRIILILLSTKNPAPIILDEPGTNISEEYKENFGKFLKTISEKLGVQIILITHLTEVSGQADSVISIKQEKGSSVVI